MRTRRLKQVSSGRRPAVQNGASSSHSSADASITAAIREGMSWRVVDVSTKLLLYQPLEPSRVIASRMHNDCTLLRATVTVALSGEGGSAPSPEPLVKGGKKNGVGKAAAAPFVEGAAFRQWTTTRLFPFGLEALNAFHLPGLALAKSTLVDDMLRTVVALLHRQGRATPAERKQAPAPITPIFYDAAEEIEVHLVVPFLLALVEQELCGIAPGFTSRLLLSCSTMVMQALRREMGQSVVAASPLPSPSAHTTTAEDGAVDSTTAPIAGMKNLNADAAANPNALMTAKIARLNTSSEAFQLSHYLCKCVNRGARASAARHSRRSSLSATRTNPHASLDSSRRRSRSRSTPSEWPENKAGGAHPLPLTNADLDTLMEPLFQPADGLGPLRVPATVTAGALRRALFVLVTALWSVYEVAVPLAALLCSRVDVSKANSISGIATSIHEKLMGLSDAIALLLQDESCDPVVQCGIDAAEAMLVEDFAAVLRSSVLRGSSNTNHSEASIVGTVPLCTVPSELSGLQKGLLGGGVDCGPETASIWMQCVDWTLQIAESVVLQAGTSNLV